MLSVFVDRFVEHRFLALRIAFFHTSSRAIADVAPSVFRRPWVESCIGVPSARLSDQLVGASRRREPGIHGAPQRAVLNRRSVRRRGRKRLGFRATQWGSSEELLYRDCTLFELTKLVLVVDVVDDGSPRRALDSRSRIARGAMSTTVCATKARLASPDDGLHLRRRFRRWTPGREDRASIGQLQSAQTEPASRHCRKQLRTERNPSLPGICPTPATTSVPGMHAPAVDSLASG
jgi:hypothetical protein